MKPVETMNIPVDDTNHVPEISPTAAIALQRRNSARHQIQSSVPGRTDAACVRRELLSATDMLLSYAKRMLSVPLDDDATDVRHDLEHIIVAAQRFSEKAEEVMNGPVCPLPTGERRGDRYRQIRHDLRTPLNVIIGFGEMLLEDVSDIVMELHPEIDGLVAEAHALAAHLQRWFPPVEDGGAAISRPAANGISSRLAAIYGRERRVEPMEKSTGETGYILVVDDNDANRELLSRRLLREGHRVAHAVNDVEALAKLRRESFDLLLLDLMMSEKDGFDILREIKGDLTLHDVPVIMISALDEIASVIRCIEAGAEDYLTKPFDPVLLRARINAGLARRFWQKREKEHFNRLQAEQEKSKALLLNILPKRIVDRLGGEETLIADRFDEVTVLFSDVVGFTKIAARTAPEILLRDLNTIFSRFDRLSQDLGVEKIKTIGDAYMAVAGVPGTRPDHAEATADMALGMLEAMETVKPNLTCPFDLRIGIHTGPVVAGVIGNHKFAYDVWGDTVNYASRMESSGLPNLIQVSEATRRALVDAYEFMPGGGIRVKGKGRVDTYFLTGRNAR